MDRHDRAPLGCQSIIRLFEEGCRRLRRLWKLRARREHLEELIGGNIHPVPVDRLAEVHVERDDDDAKLLADRPGKITGAVGDNTNRLHGFLLAREIEQIREAAAPDRLDLLAWI